MKFFTILAATAFATMSASAAVDVNLTLVSGRTDISQVGYDDNGVFWYVSDGVDNRELDADGNPVGDFGNTIFGLEKFDLPSAGKYVFAFDYKMDQPDFFNWLRMRRTWDDGTSITMDQAFDKISTPFTVSDNWQTYYIPLIDTNVWDWHSESWDGDNGDQHVPYMLIDQDANGKVGPFTLQMTNARVLSNDEAVAEIAANPGDQEETIYNFHGLLSDWDEAEGYTYYYIPEAGLQEGEQAIIGTNQRIIAINPENKYFAFDYNSSDSFDIHVFAVMEETDWYAREVGMMHIDGRDDFGLNLDDPENWATASVDLSEIIGEGFGKNFGEKHYLWLQCYEAPNFAMFYVTNPRWTKDGESAGVETISKEIKSGEAVYYNIQGVKVANPSNGLFIKVQDGKSSKVLVK